MEIWILRIRPAPRFLKLLKINGPFTEIIRSFGVKYTVQKIIYENQSVFMVGCLRVVCIRVGYLRVGYLRVGCLRVGSIKVGIIRAG